MDLFLLLLLYLVSLVWISGQRLRNRVAFKARPSSTAVNYQQQLTANQGDVFVLKTVTSFLARILMSLFSPSGC